MLESSQQKILDYLLDEDDKNNFLSNKEIKINKKWNFMLNYPPEIKNSFSDKISIGILSNKIGNLLLIQFW